MGSSPLDYARSLGLVLLAFSAPASAQVLFAPHWPFVGDSSEDELGWSVSGAGDVDGDGTQDAIVGAPFNDNGAPDAGLVRVFSGALGTVLYTIEGAREGDRFGWSVSGAGDVNDDGYADFVVGSRLNESEPSDSGTVRIFSGATGAVLYIFESGMAGDRFGWSVSGAGDVNSDGSDDVIVGAPRDDPNGPSSGSAYVFSGATGEILYTLSGSSQGSTFGQSVSDVGDVNGDGIDDFVIGAPGDKLDGVMTGSASVYSGATGTLLFTFWGDSEGDEFGDAVSGAGDVNADGFADLIIGARSDDQNGSASGSAFVFSGADGQRLYSLHGDARTDYFGWSVSGIGDADGDGLADVLVGAPSDDPHGSASGSARVFSGATGAVICILDGDSTGDHFGYSVSGVGDVNHDGFADFIIGSIYDEAAGTAAGSARIFFSVPVPPNPCPADFNGDGSLDTRDFLAFLNAWLGGC